MILQELLNGIPCTVTGDTLRTVEDTFRLKEYIKEHNPKSAVLAGGGFGGFGGGGRAAVSKGGYEKPLCYA